MAAASSQPIRTGQGFLAGGLIGTLGGLIGLGGAEFRLPVLVGWFGLPTLEAIIFNKAMSLVVVAVALVARLDSIPVGQMLTHAGVAINLLAGSLIGAWWAAGHAMTMSRRWLDRVVLVLLVGLALLLLSEAWLGLGDGAAVLVEAGWLRLLLGLAAGFGIGMVAALLGVAGGELLIPTIVLLYGLDIKLAGSLSLAVSLPTMLVGFARYSRADAFAVLGRERTLFGTMAAGSVLGALLGGLLLGWVPAHLLTTLLGAILLISAFKTFQHNH
ncbi:sulfite exporter TauE/SafE family protein [Allochromatium tepidum]|uniref:Probable membrane transporter protein n=1 Tax=Allochromatium tepidum TaxID=553982 RepID=A0ABM7QL22_9GAMM|nr:sulfite exporter TauE/SafE family protein [Allochromatium tepidum]BCU06429.1 UPF0721 transmembrane protein [Allochromatium tepidum]